MKSHVMLICIQVHQIKGRMGGTCRKHGRYEKPSLFFIQNFKGTDLFGGHGTGFRKKRGIKKNFLKYSKNFQICI
jgi:hypothetical protein